MKGIVLFAILVAGCAYNMDPQLTDLELYEMSALAGLHSHPTGPAGAEIERAERRVERRRAAIRSWVIGSVGERAVSELEDDLTESAYNIHWLRGPTEDEEWAAIEEATRALRELERRKRRTDRDM